MGFFVFLGVLFVLIFGFLFFKVQHENEKLAAMSPAELAAHLFGVLNEHLICPHCQTKGLVRVKQVLRIVESTGKVGGILKTDTKSQTKVIATQHHCDQCSSTWDI